MPRDHAPFVFLIGLAFAIAGCSGDGPGNNDAGDAVADAGDADLRDVVVGPDADFCDGYEFQGPDPGGQVLPPDGEHEIRGAAIHGHHVVYADSRQDDPGYFHIYVFDLAGWTELNITDGIQAVRAAPWIFGGEVIWTDLRDNTWLPGDNRAELYHYDILSGVESRLTDSPSAKGGVQFNEDYLLHYHIPDGETWEELVLVHRASGDSTTLSDIDSGAEGYFLGTQYISWVAWPPGSTGTGNKDIYYHDLRSGETVWLDFTRTGSQQTTSVSGDRIVWMDNRSGDWDVYLYDIGLDLEENISDDPFDQMNPMIVGDLVVMRDYRFTMGWESAFCVTNLTVLDLSTRELRRITTHPWYWPTGLLTPDGLMLAPQAASWFTQLYVFDLVDLEILDASGQHVVPVQNAQEVFK